MRSWSVCTAWVLLAGLLSGPAVSATVQEFAVPGTRSWLEVQQGALNPASYLETIDFTTDALGGLMPVEPSVAVAVPVRPAALAGATQLDSVLALGDGAAILKAAEGLADDKRPDGALWSQAQLAALTSYLDSMDAFSWNVAQREVVAVQDAELEDGTSVDAGDVLLERLNDFPSTPHEAELLRLAGIDSIAALVNVADRFDEAGDADELAAKYNKDVSLILFGLFETAMKRANRMVKLPELVLDGDPYTTFERYDESGSDVLQKFIFYLDLGRYFPVGLTRIHPYPGSGGKINAYTLRVGVEGTEVEIAGSDVYNAAIPGHPDFVDVADGMPSFVIVQSDPNNPVDTIAVGFDPPRRVQWLRLDIQTDQGYDLAEWQVLADGFLPTATFETVPLEFVPATLGRVYWDEDWVGDPSKSEVQVRFRTGTTPEPDVYYRFDAFNEDIPWSVDAAPVVDRRPEAATYLDTVDLNDPKYRLDMRQIYTALTAEERLSVRLTRAEYAGLKLSERAQIEPDLTYWSGYQTAEQGDLVPAPSGNQYLQFRIDLLSEDARAARIIRNLRFEYASPQAAGRVLAEIGPAVGVAAGLDTAFTLAMETPLEIGTGGFNRIKVDTPARIGAITDLSIDWDGAVQQLTRQADGATTEPGPGEYSLVALEDRYFVIGLDPVYPSGDGTAAPIVTLSFGGRVIDFRTTFGASIYLDTLGVRDRTEYTRSGILVLDDTDTGVDTLGTILPQQAKSPLQGESVVDLLETAGLADRNSLSVAADISGGRSLLDNIGLSPNPFSPNGDGVNDEVAITYDVLRLINAGTISVQVYDLSGRSVRALRERQLTSGGYTEIWDGTDDAGDLVAPGVYMVRINADVDVGEKAIVHTVAVAY